MFLLDNIFIFSFIVLYSCNSFFFISSIWFNCICKSFIFCIFFPWFNKFSCFIRYVLSFIELIFISSSLICLFFCSIFLSFSIIIFSFSFIWLLKSSISFSSSIFLLVIFIISFSFISKFFFIKSFSCSYAFIFKFKLFNWTIYSVIDLFFFDNSLFIIEFSWDNDSFFSFKIKILLFKLFISISIDSIVLFNNKFSASYELLFFCKLFSETFWLKFSSEFCDSIW